jgi:hypothetical protein
VIRILLYILCGKYGAFLELEQFEIFAEVIMLAKLEVISKHWY